MIVLCTFCFTYGFRCHIFVLQLHASSIVAWTRQEGSGSDMAGFVLSKFIKKSNPGKNREIARNTPRIARNPVNFFWDLDPSEVQRSFFFSAVCFCEVAMETRETFEALLAGLKADKVPPAAQALAEASGLSGQVVWSHKKP